MKFYRVHTDGINHRTGRPVRVFARTGRWWLHIEFGSQGFGWYWHD